MTTNAKQLLKLVRLEPLQNRDEATALAVSTARLELEMERAALTRDERLEALKLDFDLQIENFAGEIERNKKRLSAWAVTNRKAEFGDKQSVTLAGHTLAFRKGTGKVEFVPGVTGADVLDRLLSHPEEIVTERFVTISPSINKAAILAAWGNTELRAVLEAIGIQVTKGESFNFTANRDALPDIAAVAVGKEIA